MAKYTLVIKKGEITLELTSEDKELIERELGSWIVLASASSESTREVPSIEDDEVKQMEEETKEILRKAIHEPEKMEEEPRKTKNEIETVSDAKEVEVSDDFSKVFQEKMTQTQTSEEENIDKKAIEIAESIPEIPMEPVTKPSNTIDKFANIVSSKKIKTEFDCLMACAYHLVERENFERFTLKQINTLAKALIEDPIEHDTLKEALDKELIKIVPDLTGTSDTMEYTLTDAGIGYFKNELE